MTRRQNLPELPPVASFEVAPHRYRYDTPFDPNAPIPTTYKEVRAAAPYQKGDVVYVVYGDSFARAIVVATFCDRDGCDDLREYYEVRRETKAGFWAKQTYKAYPGFIQRGYQRAGLAPEMPTDI